MMRPVARYGVVFAIIGMVVAITLLSYDYLVLVGPDGYNTASQFDAEMILVLCPPALALMGLERVHGVQLLFGLSVIAAMNAALYSVAGHLLGVMIEKVNRVIRTRDQ